MNLHQLKIFEAIAEKGSFSAAADDHCLDPVDG